MNEHTKAWSASVAAADAFVFVLPEYDHHMPSSLVNAMQYLYREWTYQGSRVRQLWRVVGRHALGRNRAAVLYHVQDGTDRRGCHPANVRQEDRQGRGVHRGRDHR